MERTVGETFNFEGVKLQVQSTSCEAICNGCYLGDPEHVSCLKPNPDNCIGHCYGPERSDGKNVIFVEVDYDKEE